MPKSIGKFKVGRDAGSGRFILVATARSHKRTAIVETIKKKAR
jgi:hypothetical protein